MGVAWNTRPLALSNRQAKPYLRCMRVVLTFLMVFAMIGVVGVLGAGILGFVRGGGDPERSNRLMRWRVILQAVAILLFVLLLTIFRR